MKNKFLLVSMFLISLSISKAFSQTTVSLDITLNDVVSLTVSSNNVAFAFSQASDYTNGVTTAVPDHLVATSSRGYTISVVAGTATGVNTISPSTVLLQAAAGSSGYYTGVSYTSSLTLPAVGSPAALITATNSTFSGTQATTNFNVSYNVGKNSSYANLTQGGSVSHIPVVYTISQP